MPQPTIVLVHGAWADASSWNPVATELQSQGFTVLAPPNLLRTVTVDAPYTTPSGPGAWKNLPSWGVIGTEDLVIPPATQRSMAERAGATITEAPGSHVSMVSHPQVTIDAILAAAAEVGD
jgi:pimeloyl-ACP methyl ester carboxylesterase